MPINALTENDFKPQSFEEARRKFARKVALTSKQFDRLSVKNRANAFRVATVNNARIVQQLRRIVEQAIDEGTPLRTVRQRLVEEFTKAGIGPAPLNRLRFSYLEQVRQSYSEARVEMLDEHSDTFGFRQYFSVGNGTPGFANVRPEHAELHGKVFAWDDPAWDFFTPPWDFGCRCFVVPLTEGTVLRGNMTVWTYSGGAIRPTSGPRRQKAVKMKPNPDYSRSAKDIDLSELDADLRRVVTEALK